MPVTVVRGHRDTCAEASESRESTQTRRFQAPLSAAVQPARSILEPSRERSRHVEPGIRIASAGGERAMRLAAGFIAAAALAGCASSPSQPVRTTQVAALPPPSQQALVYVYPAGGQDERQLDRDRYECHRWAVRQSSFDPSLPGLPPQQRVQVVRSGPPPGSQVAAGAVTGAVIGAAVSNPWEQGEGALIGAAAGALLGAVVESSQNQQVATVQSQYDQAAAAEQEQRAGEYRRAISACLAGRGYSVR